jgi:hypothetical protein
MISSQSRQIPNMPVSTRLSAARTARCSLELRFECINCKIAVLAQLNPV